MKVKLVSLTTGQDKDGNELGPEEIIVGTARVSSGRSDDELYDDYPKLIKYLIRNKHWSPFEMADMTVEIVTSRAIAQQILRHRSFSFQEFSQRYAAVQDLEPIEFRVQAIKNRQSSTDNFEDQDIQEWVSDFLKESQQLYNVLIDAGVAKESARFVLPLTTQTRIYMKGSVRSWIHYLQIRLDEHTQKEHREVAEAIKDIFCDMFPNIANALNYFENE